MAEATTPCTPSQLNLDGSWPSLHEGDIGKGLRNAVLLSIPLYALGLAMVLVALRGCP